MTDAERAKVYGDLATIAGTLLGLADGLEMRDDINQPGVVSLLRDTAELTQELQTFVLGME